ncbi:LysR family transcriptional regulator [Methylophaga sulfidovorans]|uniref:LysR family transcriptional regulator, regulator for metE and metH n=1 Tax=Methylophaga sulfidovorans TaxID=45496 RepID=A0A1I3WCN0_9GAMM|nr:LysR family transcriptional regulator [Methylophaga sulfidovorans]SFK05288.1 LysR family transcriptional regulator, regulator for metE and metH [Methylophaga sulfidovorans]
MIELTHLKIIQALAEHGSLTAAANALYVTQPALTHQIRYLEQKLEIRLWERQGRKLRLTQAGQLLLRTARQLLPVIEQAENTLQAMADGKQGILKIGVECHPCYEWLKAILADYLVAMPKMDVDIVHKFQFSGLEGLLNHHIDCLVTPDKVEHKDLYYTPLFEYELVLLVANTHSLSKQAYIEPEALESELLMTFPVPHERLDIYTQFLLPANVKPQHKTMESLDIMVQMASLNRGVTVLPDWLAKQYCQEIPASTVRLGQRGVMKTLFAAMRDGEMSVPYMATFLEMGQKKGAL